MMRIIQLHCDSIEYTPTKKEIKSAEEIEPKKTRIEEVVVCFTAVEEMTIQVLQKMQLLIFKNQ